MYEMLVRVHEVSCETPGMMSNNILPRTMRTKWITHAPVESCVSQRSVKGSHVSFWETQRGHASPPNAPIPGVAATHPSHLPIGRLGWAGQTGRSAAPGTLEARCRQDYCCAVSGSPSRPEAS